MVNATSVLITGCSTGIGYCVAKGLQADGYCVFTTARKQEDIDRLNAEGLNAYYMDYAEAKSVDQLADTVLEKTGGRLFAVFHNGAYGQSGAVEDLPREAIELQFASNVVGWIHLTNRLLPAMRNQQSGRVIFNSSVLGLVALRYRGAYNASKFAIEGFADTLRLELYNTPIQISLIEPGPIESQFRNNAYKAFQRFIKPEESIHQKAYAKEIERMQKQGHAAPFTLPADAVLVKVQHALRSSKPKPRYYVTFPTYLFGYLRRVLSTRILDRLLLKV